MKQANCPACGASVVFRSTASIMAVCEYCRSTLVRRDAEVENIGKMAELLEDASVIQLGSEGRYQGMRFTVIGRIQLQYPQGFWNEWYLQFDNLRNGWLGEANGDYVMTFPTKVPQQIPGVAEMSPGLTVTLNGKPFTVTDVENGRCIAGAGELPFRVEAGFAASSVDLRAGKNFASIDYSEETPLVFIGEAVEAAELKLANLRDPAATGAAKTTLHALQCPACAAPIELHAQGILSVTCPSCHTLLDAEEENLKLLKKFAAKKRITPAIALGSEGKFDGVSFRVIGFLRRQGECEGETFSWDEYLLYNPTQGFRWLTEFEGEWNYSQTCKSAPVSGKGNTLVLDGRTFTHSETTLAKVTYVEGEFYWRVSDEERVTIDEFVAAPYTLAQETYRNEITWTQGKEINPEVVQRAFGLAKSAPVRLGIVLNQWPHEESYRVAWRSFWIASLLMLCIQGASLFRADDTTVFKQDFELPAGNTWGGTSAEFEVTGHKGNIHLINQTNLDNDWVYVGMELVSRETGQVYAVHREISYYHGNDDGGWTEGSTRDDAMIGNVPPGHYLLTLEAETDPARKSPVHTTLEVQRNVSNWHNFLIIECLLLAIPGILYWRRSAFKAGR